MAAKAYGSITIVDISDLGTLSVIPTSNHPSTVIYDPNTTNYTPDWSIDNLTLTASAYYSGTAVTPTSVTWYKKINSETTRTVISGATSSTLTVSTNEFAATGTSQVTYIVAVTYVDPHTNQTMGPAEGQITFSKLVNATLAKSCSIIGESIFFKDGDGNFVPSDASITLTGTVQNCIITKWQYKNTSNVWTDFSPAQVGNTLTIAATSFSNYKNTDRSIVVRLVTTESGVYDEHTIAIVADGAVGDSTIVASLSNEEQMVAYDKNGDPVQGTFDTASSTVSVYLGNTDVSSSSNTTITVANTSTLPGANYTWNAETHTVKVNSLPANTTSATVVFTIVYSDAAENINRTITKTFTITKVSAGADGITPTIYRMNVTPLALNVNNTPAFTVTSLTVTAESIYGNTISPYNGSVRIYQNASATPINTYTLVGGTVDIPVTYSSSIVYYTVKLFEADTENLLDSQKVVITKDGIAGTDGAGVQFVYKADSPSVTPPTPTGTTYPPSGWSTTVPTVASNQALYMSQRTSTDAIWSAWSAPIRISGRGVSSVTNYYQVSSSATTAPDETTTWPTDPSTLTLSTTNKYLWNYEKITYSDGTFLKTAKTVIGTYGDIGDTGNGIQSITEYYAVNNSNTAAPVGSTNPAANPTIWSTSLKTTTITNRYLWNVEVIAYTDGTSTITTAVIIGTHGENGVDGSDIQYAYYRTASTTAPSAPTGEITTAPPQTNTWATSPSGVTESLLYEYVSVRTKAAGATDFGAWSNPVIWSKWGVKGQDGDGVEYKYFLSNSASAPSTSATGWTEEPSGVSETNQYEYVSTRISTAGVWGAWRDAKLWAKYGQTGETAISALLGNYSDQIPCAPDGKVLNDTILTIPYYAYKGIEKVDCTATFDNLAPGMELTNYADYPTSIKVPIAATREGTGDPSLDNIRAVVGVDSVEVTRCGKNLWEFGDIQFTTYIKNIFSNSIPAGTYTIKGDITSTDTEQTTCTISFRDINNADIAGIALQRTSGDIKQIKLTRPCKVIYLYASTDYNYSEGDTATFSNMSLVPGSVALTTQVPYAGTTHTIALPETSYGGYIDWTRGKYVQTHRFLSLAVADMNNENLYPGWTGLSQLKIDIPNCNSSYPAITNIGNIIWINTISNNAILHFHKNIYPLTQTEWKTQYPDLTLEVAYELPTPIEYNITLPTPPTTVVDTNIFSQFGFAETATQSLAKILVSKDSTLGNAAKGTIDVTLTAQEQTFLQYYNWTKSIQGESAIYFDTYAEPGNLIQNGIGDITLKSRMLYGSTAITPASHLWKIYNVSSTAADKWETPTNINTDADYTVANTEVKGYASYRCEAVYGDTTYTSYIVVQDKTDPIQVEIVSTIGNQLVNGIGVGALYAVIYRAGEEIDPILEKNFGDTMPTASTSGTYYYYLNATTKTITVYKKTNGTWSAISDPHRANCYQWYMRDETGADISGVISATDLQKKVIFLDSSVVNKKVIFDVEVTL